jgi:glycosyltransferase involved in cell wall biosynthesis
LYYQHVLRPGCQRAHAVLTVSEYSKARIVAWSGVDPERVHNVGNGVDPSFHPGVAAHAHPRPYVLAVSNRRTHKNERRLFEAFAASAAAHDHDLLITGQPTPALDALAAQLGIQGRVSFLGSVTDASLPGLYRGAKLLFFPSLYEGFGLPLIEAMACGTPCVTSSVTAMPEVAGDAALCVDPLNVPALTAALDAALLDPDLRQRLGQAGLRRAAAYTWDRVVQRTRQALAGVTPPLA